MEFSNSLKLQKLTAEAENLVLKDNNCELVLSAHIDMGECSKVGILLGVLWDGKTDTFLFNVDELERKANQSPVTKGQLLCIIASIFDRLSSFTVN